MPRTRAPRHTLPLLAGAGLASLLALALPSVGLARSQRAVDPWPETTPATRALTGGLARLTAPGSLMVRLPATSFWMGSTEAQVLEALATCRDSRARGRGLAGTAAPWPSCTEEAFQIELPRHQVHLSSFWIDRTEVTVSAYARCVKLGRCEPVRYARGARRFSGPLLPVSLLTYQQATTYCRFRGARLPTEAEFERAARGPQGRLYPWGNLYNSHASNHGRLGILPTDARDGHALLANVGSYPQGGTPEGVLDLAGNVAEWVSDAFDFPYPSRPVTDPTGPSGSGRFGAHVVRGGHFESAPPMLRGAARSAREPSATSPTVGLRCARSTRTR